MKTKLSSLTKALVASGPLWIGDLPAQAQGDSVTNSAAEFQRLVYSSHLNMQLDKKPELDACLQVLLELQRRNPNADPAALADLSQQTLASYRANVPSYIRKLGFRDEILAAYLTTLGQVPAHTNFAPATFSLLNKFLLNPTDYALNSPSELINKSRVQSGNRRLLNVEKAPFQRRALLDDCLQRVDANTKFGQAWDDVLGPEIGVLRAHTAGQILSVNSALSNSPTMQAMLASSLTHGGSVILTTNELKNLFSLEMVTMHEIINTNLAVRREILNSQADTASYLTNSALMEANQQFEEAASEGQSEELAASEAAVHAVSHLTSHALPEVGEAMFKVGEGVRAIGEGLSIFGEHGGWKAASKFGKAAATGNLIAGGLMLFGAASELGLFGETEDPIDAEFAEVKGLISELTTNVDYRFDEVDKSLTEVLGKLDETIQSIDGVNDNVDDARQQLVDVQADLHRMERQLQSYIVQLYASIQDVDFNYYLGHNYSYPSTLLTLSDYAAGANEFYTHARNYSVGTLSSPYAGRDYSASGLYVELSEGSGGISNRLDQNFSYIKSYLNSPLGLTTGGTLGELANPRDWFVGSFAFMQLSAENPSLFRQGVNSNILNQIIQRGEQLTNFLGSLTFTGNSINWPLFSALIDNYDNKLNAFLDQVHEAEHQFGADTTFDADTWRPWFAAATQINVTNTEVVAVPHPVEPLTRVAARIAAGSYHNLALKTDGTVLGWGADNLGQVTAIPSDVRQVSAGEVFSLGLKEDGTVIGWGDDTFGQTDIPASATNVTAISAGLQHALALRADGTVVGWGDNADGQTGVPVGLSNVVSIAAGQLHSLALRANGTVVGWSTSFILAPSFTNIPPSASNVVAIAAHWTESLALRADGNVVGWGTGGVYDSRATNAIAIAQGGGHGLALLTNGTVVGWGQNDQNQITIPAEATNVVAIAAGYRHSLALRSDGTVVQWGYNWGSIPFGLSNVVAIADGDYHSLAVKSDGTVVGWGIGEFTSGYPFRGQAVDQTSPARFAEIAAGGEHSLGLRANGTVIAWGDNSHGESGIPATATNSVKAIAAGSYHSLALKTDGNVIGWGYSGYGAVTIPSSATSVMKIAAGWGHSLALRTNGTIIGWGYSYHGETNIPGIATGVVDIAAGYYHNLALKADGTVVGWGYNQDGEAIGVATANPPIYGATGLVMVAGQTLTNVMKIAAGGYHSLALLNNGTVVGWGSDGLGQTTTPLGLTNVVEIKAGFYTSMARKSDGTIVVWGDNSQGQRQVPTVPFTWAGSIAAGGAYPMMLSLKANGNVVAFGYNNYAQTNVPASATGLLAIAVGQYHCVGIKPNGVAIAWGGTATETNLPASAYNLVSVAAGYQFSLGLKADGHVIGWGDSTYGSTNTASLSNIMSIASGPYHSLALRSNGTVVAWGLNNHGQTNVPGSATSVIAVAAGGGFSLALRADGTPIGWGDNTGTIPASASSGVIAIAAGSAHGLALKADGKVVAWGSNGYGQTSIPAGLSGVVAIAAGWNSSVAVKADGSIVTWGDLSYPNGALIPAGLTSVKAVAAGNEHFLALKSDGTVVGWGANSTNYGQATVPASATSVRAIAAGDYHSLALKNNGTVVAWGLGTNNTGLYPVYGQAMVPPGLNNVVAIAASERFSLALKDNGTVVGWGYSINGQTNPPASASNVVAIAAGLLHGLALRADGVIIGWGLNNIGQAIGVTGASVTNGPVIGLISQPLSNVVAIAAGDYHGLALLNDGTVFGWGYNLDGQVNSVPNPNFNKGPVVIGGQLLTNVVAIAAAGNYSVALKADGRVVGWGSNENGQRNFPADLTNVLTIAAGRTHSLFVKDTSQSGGNGGQPVTFVRRQLSERIPPQFLAVNDAVVTEMGSIGSIHPSGIELAGAKALLQTVLELGMPYTMEQDDVLHGYFYGNEGLPDLDIALGLVQADTTNLLSHPDAKPQILDDVTGLRESTFVQRLNDSLLMLQTNGKPEIPRLVGHTLRLLDLLRDSWISTPPSALEIAGKTNGLDVLVYGEPYVRYTLQQSSTATAGWTDTTITNLRSADSPLGTSSANLPVSSAPTKFYRVKQAP